MTERERLTVLIEAGAANGMEIEKEEEIVDMFARGLYQVLQDNGARLFDLKDAVK